MAGFCSRAAIEVHEITWRHMLVGRMDSRGGDLRTHGTWRSLYGSAWRRHSLAIGSQRGSVCMGSSIAMIHLPKDSYTKGTYTHYMPDGLIFQQSPVSPVPDDQYPTDASKTL